MQEKSLSLDEMWKVIEEFGINRRMLEDKMNDLEVKDLYLLICKSNSKISR